MIAFSFNLTSLTVSEDILEDCRFSRVQNPYLNNNGIFVGYMPVIVLFIFVGCRRDMLDNTSCGFVMYISRELFTFVK